MKYTAFIAALLLAACNPTPTHSSAAASAASSTNPIPASAEATSTANPLPLYKIRIANQPYPPFNIFLENNSFDGLEIDILNAIAARQGFRVEFQPYIWELIFKDLNKSQSHMVAGGLAADDIDLNELNLSVPYMRSPDCVVTTQEAFLNDWHKRNIVTMEDDELDDTLVETYKVSRHKINHAKSQYHALGELLKKEADATISDCNVLKYYINGTLKKETFYLKELPIDSDDTSYDLLLGVSKTEPELLKKINAGIEQLKQSGELDKIINKWTEKSHF